MSSKAGKRLVPTLRFPEFRDSPGWEQNLLNGMATPVKERGGLDESHRILTLSGEVGIVSQGDYFGKKIAGENTDRYIGIKRNDFVYNDRTTKSFTYGAIKRLFRYEAGLVSPIYKCFRFQGTQNPIFWEWYFESRSHERQLKKLVNEGARAGRYNISIDNFLSMPAWSPRQPEQDRVAACLSSVDDLIGTQVRKIEALKAHKKGLMQQIFPAEGETVPHLRFPEFREARGWQEKNLRSVCAKIMDGTHFSPKSKTGPRMYLTSKNIQNGVIDLSNLSFISEEDHQQIYTKCPVTKNDVLLTKDGAKTGNCALNTINLEFSLLSSVAVLRGIKALLDQRFLYQAILSDSFQKNIREAMSGQAITRITLEKIGAFKIAIPCIEEQYIVANCLSSLDEIIAAYTQKLEALKVFKKGLMQGLFPSLNETDA